MNSLIHRYMPPALVLGAAVFFGWPPPKPLDLGEDVVRATAVRWKPADLSDPPPLVAARDPFDDPPATVEEIEVAVEDIAPVGPISPDAETLKGGLQFDGIANVGGRSWAILNGRPRLEGDTVHTNDVEQHKCQIVSVQSDRIVIRCQETTVELLAHEARAARKARQSKDSAVDTNPPAKGDEDSSPKPAPRARRSRAVKPGGTRS